MKFIPLGLHCSVPEGLRKANVREYSYPFDWNWSPSKTTYNILYTLLHNGVDSAVQYIISDYKYYTFIGNGVFESSNMITDYQLNEQTGFGVAHFTINDDYIYKLKERFTRLLNDIKLHTKLIFIYADAANPNMNYIINNVVYGLNATNDLLNIYDLLISFNNNIELLYFCWKEHSIVFKNNIQYIEFDYQPEWSNVSAIIANYIINNYNICNKPDKITNEYSNIFD